MSYMNEVNDSFSGRSLQSSRESRIENNAIYRLGDNRGSTWGALLNQVLPKISSNQHTYSSLGRFLFVVNPLSLSPTTQDFRVLPTFDNIWPDPATTFLFPLASSAVNPRCAGSGEIAIRLWKLSVIVFGGLIFLSYLITIQNILY